MLRSTLSLFLTLVVTSSLVGSAWAACPVGDLDGDCDVDFMDVYLLAWQWLFPSGSEADIDGTNGVTLVDLAKLAENWGVVGERTGSVEVEITPKAAINLGAKWRIDGGPWLDSGERVSELAVGSHLVEFKAIDTWVKPADEEVSVSEGLITPVNAAYKHPLKINEFMASNSGNALNSPEGNAKDEHGQYDDWIELFNSSDSTIDAAGMYLRDADDNVWRFPSNNPLTSIVPGGYLLIWADNWADNDVNVGPLHANFKLSANGDKILLYDTDGESLIDSIDFGEQTTDISYGRDVNDDWRFFPYPSPGWENEDAYIDAVSDTKFSHNRGFYDAPFSVTIATETKGATIKYTTDDTVPSETTGQEYTGPIPINTTTCLRAMAFKPGWKPTDVDTHTYIFVDDVIDHPKMSTVITHDRIWGSKMRPALLEIPTISLVTPYTIPDEPIQSPPEVPVSIEMIFPDGTEGFQANGCVERFGGQYTVWPKQALRVSFKSIYGPSRLNFDLFSDTPYGGDDAADSFNQIILRNGSHDSIFYGGYTSKGTYIRNRYCFDRQFEMGHLSLRGKFVHMYLNGVYWGLYHLMERPTADFMATYLGGEEEDYDIMKGRSGIFAAEGNREAWDYLVSHTNNYEIVQEYMDVDNYIDYMLLNFYGGNDHDWYSMHNWYAGRRREAGNKFIFFMWDNDFLMRRLNGNTIDNGGPSNMFPSLIQHEDFRIRLADRAQKLFFDDGMLTPDRVRADFDELANRIARLIVPECARWLNEISWGTYTPTSWQQYVDWIKFNWANVRTNTVLQQMRDAGLLPDVDAPRFYVNGEHQHGGYISSSDSISMTAEKGTIYYTTDGTDPRIPKTSGMITTTLVARNASKRLLVPDGPLSESWRGGAAFDDTGWYLVSGSPGGVGYDEGSDYDPFISYDVESLMNGDVNPSANPSALLRIQFNVDADDLARFSAMKLKVQYDDGFVAYINGQEVARANFTTYTGEPEWNSHASAIHEDAQAVVFEEIDISDHIDALRAGQNILAIQGMNISTTSSDFLINAELVAGQGTGGGVHPAAIAYTGPFTLGKSTHIKARAKSGATWSALNEATFAVGPVAEGLRITEIMYHPQETGNPDDPNEEFIELTNVGPETINLNLVRFTNGLDLTFGDVDLVPGGYVVVVKDVSAFAAAHPEFSGVIAAQYNGSLNNAGERIELVDALGQTIHDFRYRDGWRSITDGGGFSLTIIDPTSPDPNSWGEKDAWRASVYAGGSPGTDDSGIIPNPGAIVINEVLAHSHAAAPDWIELYNTTDSEIDIGGWYLSDSELDLKKYRFAEPTRIQPYAYLVVYEDANFGEAAADPGRITGFALNENGDEVYLSSAEGGVLTGYREVEEFGASATGISFGRYFKSSTGNYNFVPMREPTPRGPNAYPQVGPIVISEIMYNPDWPAGGVYVNDSYEYIELRNIGSEPVALYRYDKGSPWKFTSGVEFVFPDQPDEVIIPAGESIVVVRDPDAFMWRYPFVPAEKVYGPYTGRLANDGERLELSMPGDIDEFGHRYYIRVDRVVYSDGSHPEGCPGGVDLWPEQADGGGKSLTRIVPELYGNDPNNWTAATPSPGG